jgi:hypothetical protein
VGITARRSLRHVARHGRQLQAAGTRSEVVHLQEPCFRFVDQLAWEVPSQVQTLGSRGAQKPAALPDVEAVSRPVGLVASRRRQHVIACRAVTRAPAAWTVNPISQPAAVQFAAPPSAGRPGVPQASPVESTSSTLLTLVGPAMWRDQIHRPMMSASRARELHRVRGDED